MNPLRPTKLLFQSAETTNRHFEEVMPGGSWHGHPAFIVGGGPSLRGFDFSRLRGRRSIGVNLAFYAFDPTIIFSMDTRFLNWIFNGTYDRGSFPGLRAKFEKTAAYKVWLLTYSASLAEDIFIVPVHKSYQDGLGSFTLRYRDGIGHGNNSGYAALNLAVILGANPIYLLGFDCNRLPDASHWHAGHPVPQNPKHLDSFIPRFETAAAATKKAGIRVVNLNPASALRCFEFGSLEEALND